MVRCVTAAAAAWALLLLADTVAGLIVRMAPEQQMVYDPENGVSPEFLGKPDVPETKWDDEYATFVRFLVETDGAEFYAPPTLSCNTGCPAAATPRIDMLEGGVGDVGNVDATRITEYYERGSLLELLVWYDCTGVVGDDASIKVNVSLQLIKPPESLDDAHKLQEELLAGDGDGTETDQVLARLFANKEGDPIVFSWYKRCAQRDSVHRGVSVSLGTTPVVADGIATPEFDFAAPSFTVSADEASTEFALEATEGSFAWDAPTVTHTATPASAVALDIAGSAAAPGFEEFNDGTDPPTLVIMYGRCDVSQTTISVTWQLPPYKAVRFSFVKLCGGGAAPGFFVTVNLPQGAVQAVRDGKPLQQFIDAKELVGPTTGATTLWVSAPEKSPVSVLRVLVSQSPTAIFKAALVGELAEEAGPHQLAGEQALLLKYFCERQGKAKVTVTFQLDKYRSASLAFTKLCEAPAAAKTQRKSWSPTGFVLGLTGTAIFVGVLFAVWRAAGNPQKVRPKRRDHAAAL